MYLHLIIYVHFTKNQTLFGYIREHNIRIARFRRSTLLSNCKSSLNMETLHKKHTFFESVDQQ